MAGKTAEAGMGTLILFIAFILVAAIAAAVLVNTAGSLQSRALTTGTKTQKQVSSGISVLTIYGENSSTTAQINYLYATIRLTAGSDPVLLNASLIDVFSGLISSAYDYNSTGNCTPSWLSNATLASKYFAVQAQEGYTLPGVLQDGDVLLTCVRLPSGLNESQKVTWEFSPKSGSFTSIKTETPPVMSMAKVFLFP